MTNDKSIINLAKLYSVWLKDTHIDYTTENGKIFKDVGFANPKNLQPYLDTTIYQSMNGNKVEVKRLKGIILFINLLWGLKKLTKDEAIYLREQLRKGFIALGGNTKLNTIKERLMKELK